MASLVFAALWLCGVLSVSAQSSLVLSVSPTLFEMSAAPDQTWSSSVRVINANQFPITVYLDAVNFEPSDESGTGTLRPILDTQPAGGTLAQWVNLGVREVTIPAEQTIDVPFTITVPDDAPPGGHFAAVLVGTKSLQDGTGQSQVQTSQVVTSLVFLRVAGDIVEQGSIRDFTTSASLYEVADATFTVRFQNEGNVHLRPQGHIEIRNMWGRERGRIPVNQSTQFGNVLPNSIRAYIYNWDAAWSIADIGRHSATITLAYGDGTRRFVDATTHFWVVPWKVLSLVLLGLVAFIALVVWGIKLYVRRMLQLAGVTPSLHHGQSSVRRRASVTAPIEAGMLDLRNQLRDGHGSVWVRLWTFTQQYRAFALVIAAVAVFAGLLLWYVVLVVKNDFAYEVQYEQADGSTVPVQGPFQADETIPNPRADYLTVINHSGDARAMTIVESKLADAPYTIVTGFEPYDQPRTASVLVYHPDYVSTVDQLRTALPGVLVSSFISSDPDQAPVVLYVGTDLIQ